MLLLFLLLLLLLLLLFYWIINNWDCEYWEINDRHTVDAAADATKKDENSSFWKESLLLTKISFEAEFKTLFLGLFIP